MSDFDDLDDLFGQLRSPATPAELAAERDVVELMATAHPSSKATTMFTSRRARVATLIAAGIIGFGGVAAAGPAAYNLLETDPPVDEPEPVTEPEVEVEVEVEVEKVTEPEVEGEPEEKSGEDVVDTGEEQVATDPEDPTLTAETPIPGVDDEDTLFDEANDCKLGNHGKTVSAAARGDADLAKYEQRVVARSSCGKMGDAGDDESEPEVEEEPDVVEEPEAEEPSEAVVEQPKAQGKGKSDEAPGKSEGKRGGNGNSGGKGNNGNGGKKGG
jgi:hypothetical protein